MKACLPWINSHHNRLMWKILTGMFSTFLELQRRLHSNGTTVIQCFEYVRETTRLECNHNPHRRVMWIQTPTLILWLSVNWRERHIVLQEEVWFSLNLHINGGQYGGGGGGGGGGSGQKPLNDSLSKRRFCQHGRQIACVRISVWMNVPMNTFTMSWLKQVKKCLRPNI